MYAVLVLSLPFFLFCIRDMPINSSALSLVNADASSPPCAGTGRLGSTIQGGTKTFKLANGLCGVHCMTMIYQELRARPGGRPDRPQEGSPRCLGPERGVPHHHRVLAPVRAAGHGLPHRGPQDDALRDPGRQPCHTHPILRRGLKHAVPHRKGEAFQMCFFFPVGIHTEDTNS